MASSLLPDPLDLLRRAVTQLENQANALAGRGLQAEPVVKALHQVVSLAMASRQVRGAAMDGVVRALNLPTSGEFAELLAVLRRIEDKLDRLVPAEAPARPRPARTRRPPSSPAAAVPPAVPAGKAATKPARKRR